MKQCRRCYEALNDEEQVCHRCGTPVIPEYNPQGHQNSQQGQSGSQNQQHCNPQGQNGYQGQQQYNQPGQYGYQGQQQYNQPGQYGFQGQPYNQYGPYFDQNAYYARNNAFDSDAVGKSRGIAALLAIFLGGFGAHYFYLGKTTAAILTIIFTIVSCGCWSIVPLIQGIVMLVMSNQQFDTKFVYTNATFPLF